MGITRLRGRFQIKDNTVTGVKLVDDSIGADKIGADAAGEGLVKNPSTEALDINVDLDELRIIADTLKTSTNITSKGNAFNGASELVELLSDGKLPVLDGSNLTGITGSVSSTIDLTDVGGNVNLALGLVKLDASGKLTALDGSALTNLPVPSISTLQLSDVENNPNQPNGLVKLDALGKLAALDGSQLINLPGGSNFVDLEEPAGVKNAVNTTFTLTNSPVLGSVHLYFNGLLQKPGASNDYTISGLTITMGTAPKSVDSLVASYRT